MKTNKKQKIVILGCGNVAWHIAKHFYTLKQYSLFVYNHDNNPLLNEFKSAFKCNVSIGLDDILLDADFYFICVSDTFVAETAKQINTKNPHAIILHTSGSVPLKDLGERICGTGVFYPLQSFSKNDNVTWTDIPLIIAGSNSTVKNKILALANRFSERILILKDKDRLTFHLAAVFVNNFTNALYVAAADLIDGGMGNENFKILLPLIQQTTRKLDTLNPHQSQTGPAKRKDEVVLKKHLHLLSKQNDLKKIYKQFSKLIQKQQSK